MSMMGKYGEKQENNQNQNQNPTKIQRKPIKVKYISSPMMVKASNAIEFRAIVQQLTGLNSGATIRRSSQKAAATDVETVTDRDRAPSSTLLAHEMELDQGWFGRDQNLTNSFLGFQSPCFFQ